MRGGPHTRDTRGERNCAIHVGRAPPADPSVKPPSSAARERRAVPALRRAVLRRTFARLAYQKHFAVTGNSTLGHSPRPRPASTRARWEEKNEAQRRPSFRIEQTFGREALDDRLDRPGRLARGAERRARHQLVNLAHGRQHMRLQSRGPRGLLQFAGLVGAARRARRTSAASARPPPSRRGKSGRTPRSSQPTSRAGGRAGRSRRTARTRPLTGRSGASSSPTHGPGGRPALAPAPRRRSSRPRLRPSRR